jgi:hypothetical protein
MSEPTEARLAVLDLDGWELQDGEACHREAPTTFSIPSSQERHSLKSGDLVKLIFRIGLRNAEGHDTEKIERMWVIVGGVQAGLFWGILDNDPYCTHDMKSGMRVVFEPRNVIAIDHSGRTADA